VVAINSDLLSASAKGGAGVRAAAAAAGLPLVGNGAEAPFTESAVCAAQAAPALVTLDARFAGRKPAPSGFNFSLPGNMVTYIMMNLLIFGATGLARQRRFGIVRRLACGPVRRFDIVGGKICGLMLLGGVQAAVMLLAGRFVFKVHLGANLGAVLVTLVVYSWVAASLGVLVGSVLHAEDKVVGVCVLTALLMGALGGGWWPLEIGPEWMRTVAHCLPTGWALDCLHQVISFGGGFAEIARPLGVLALFGAGFNALAAMLFRW
jgi:ABC-type multidrug transport system permease subunit